MSLWLKGAIEERACGGEGCNECPYQIYKDEESFACEGYKRWNGYSSATKLWFLMDKRRRGERLRDIIGEMEKDEEGVLLMTLNQIREAIDLMAGLRSELYEFTGNKHFRISPEEIDWDMKKYSDLITHWKNSDGTEVYTLTNALGDAEATEYYLREALRLGKPVQFD